MDRACTYKKRSQESVRPYRGKDQSAHANVTAVKVLLLAQPHLLRRKSYCHVQHFVIWLLIPSLVLT